MPHVIYEQSSHDIVCSASNLSTGQKPVHMYNVKWTKTYEYKNSVHRILQVIEIKV